MDAIIRTFIAAHIPDSVRKTITEFLATLRRIDADVKWVRPESLHLTLKFLGEVEEERIEPIANAIAKSTTGKASFDVALGGTGTFPNPHRPNVLWIGVRQGAENLAILAGSIEAALSELKFEREKRPFSAHLTFGRVRSQRGVLKTVEWMTETGFDSDPFRIDAIYVMKSELQRTGAVYSVLRTIKLQG